MAVVRTEAFIQRFATALPVMLHCAFGQHRFGGESLAYGPLSGALADQQTVVALTAQGVGDFHRVGNIHQITHRAEGQGIAMHKGGIQFDLAVFRRQAAVAHRFVQRKIFYRRHRIDHGAGGISAGCQRRRGFGYAFQRHSPGGNHSPHWFTPVLQACCPFQHGR